jgi:transposase InsO family protein
MKQEFPFVSIDSTSVCDICHLARHKRLPYKLSVNKATKCGELIHFDIWGPNSIHSVHGHRYFLTAVDDFSRFTWVIMLKAKSEVSLLVQQFILMIENQFNVCVKTVRTDNGPEFLIPSFYASKGIIHQLSCVETPQQNGRLERKHQHILNVGRALLFQSKLPKQFWLLLLFMQHSLSIESALLCYSLNLLFMCYTTNHLILMNLKSLVLFVMLQHFMLIEQS